MHLGTKKARKNTKYDTNAIKVLAKAFFLKKNPLARLAIFPRGNQDRHRLSRPCGAAKSAAPSPQDRKHEIAVAVSVEYSSLIDDEDLKFAK